MSESPGKIEFKKKDLPPKVMNAGIGLTAAGILLAVISYLTDSGRSSMNNIVTLMFLTSVGLGSLFLVALEYVAGSHWSTPFRRVSEFLGALLFILPLISLPLFFNMHDVFHWMHSEVVNSDNMLKSKAPYLNMNFFVIRIAAYFIIWIVFYLVITKRSRNQDATGDQIFTKKNIRTSAIFMPVFALTITFIAIDWLMSLEPHWFSTIFGVYYFSGTVLAALASATIIIVLLVENGYFVKGMIKDHYYSLGALLFAFTNFWAYIAFSQFLLIYYANLPEETSWFLHRWEGSWAIISIVLILVHFLIPYAGLLSQPSKMNPKRLIQMSIVILLAHFIDLYWIVMPVYSKEGFVFGWQEIAPLLLITGIGILVFSYKYKKENVVPLGDPKLQRGIDFRL